MLLCNGNNLSKLDVSECLKLVVLDRSNNKRKKVTISKEANSLLVSQITKAKE